MTSGIIPAVLAIFSFIALAPGMSLEEAEKILSADDFTVREKAETTLRSGGSEALVILEQLVRSDDPEVRTRASRNATPTKTH
ncbi:MAG: hypothetical protein OSA48_07460 [Akkermansiaceae bacterium]|nr:hypothetical protein [Akkermansiaceae bacterium]